MWRHVYKKNGKLGLMILSILKKKVTGLSALVHRNVEGVWQDAGAVLLNICQRKMNNIMK
jgi:hypothetical protein